MPRNQTRREFLRQSAAIGSALWLGGSAARSHAADSSPSERLNFACIGVGGKGRSDTEQIAELGNLVAICDIDDNRLQSMASTFPGARKYHDFRKLLEEMEPKIDAVVVSTPDHTHAPASMMAIRMKKHVYCQKPLTHTVYEARVLREAAAREGVATQMGNQGTALDGLRQAVEVVRSGAIGQVREVHVWTNRPGRFWKQAPDITARPAETPPVPPEVHWDLFLGPAAERPYSPLYHPFHWRGWWDFGTGALGDMACHTANMAFMALELGSPTSIVAESGEVNSETYPGWATIRYQFPARGDLAPCTLVWYEGYRGGERNLPSTDLVYGEKLSDSGSFLIGDKGVLFSPNDYGAAFSLLPKADFEGYTPPEPTLPRHGDGSSDVHQKREWVAACKGGPPPLANFDYAGPFTEAMLLGNIAVRVGEKVEWDGPNMRITNVPAANQYLSKEYRKGWEV